MPLEDTDYRLRTSYTPAGYTKPFQNVYYYKRTSGEALADLLVARWIAVVMPALAAILPTTVNTQITVEAENLFNLNDFFVQNTNIQGLWTATEPLPSFVTATFIIERSTRENKRNGRKAYGPLDESMIVGNLPTSPYAANLATLAQTLQSSLVSGTSGFSIAIPRSILVDNPNPPPAQRYEIQEIFASGDVGFSHISTQNSRKAF